MKETSSKSKFSQNSRDELVALSTVAASVGQSLQLETVLDTALEKVMEVMGVENGGIYLFDKVRGKLVLRTHRKLTKGFLKEKSIVSLGEGCAGQAAQSGEMFAAFNRSDKSFVCADSERLMGIDCLVAAPIIAKGEVLGVLELFAPVSRRLTAKEGEVLKSIGNQVGVAIENAQLYEESKVNIRKLKTLQQELEEVNKKLHAQLSQELYIAETLQKALLPQQIPQIGGWEVAVRHLSATQAARVGGDFYDFIKLPNDKIAVIVGDISGSGIEAATLTSLVKSTVRAFALEDPTPASVLSRSNHVIYLQSEPSKFVSLFYAILDEKTGDLLYSNAGHPLPMIIRRGSKVKVITLSGGSLALGVMEDVEYPQFRVQLKKNDTLFLYTDGLTENRKDGEIFGERRLEELLLEQVSGNTESLVEEVLYNAQSFSDGNLRDDVAIVALSRR